jgi:hypothetical protein
MRRHDVAGWPIADMTACDSDVSAFGGRADIRLESANVCL